MWSLCRTGFQVQVRDGFGVNSGRGRLRVCGRARSRVGMVKKGGRRFQSNPVDFGVVGVEDEDGTLLFDDLKDLGEEDDETVEEGEEEGDDDALGDDLEVIDLGSIDPDEPIEGDSVFNESSLELLGDALEAEINDGEAFEDDEDLIDIGEQEDSDAEDESLYYMPGMQHFRSISLDRFIEDKEDGYIPAIESGFVGEFTRVWSAAIHPDARFREAKNQYGRVGVNLGYNFSDFFADPEADLSDMRLEDESMIKAKLTYLATGLPSLSISTSWEVENPGAQGPQSYFHRTMVPADVDVLVQRLRPRSDKNRKIIFRSIAGFFDGEKELLTEGICEVAIHFASSRYASIAVASALDNMFKEHWKNLNLQFVDHDNASEVDEELRTQATSNKRVGGTLLKQRILREGKVLNGGILKVSSFVNHMVDVDLMDICGEDLAERLRDTMPNKVLTVEATGLIPALAVGRKLSIPVVFARKSRPITISESYQTMYQSKTKGQLSELIVSREYLNGGDRVLLIDDFLAGG
mmetsp:Transcript_18137/g.72607  ORF Transcript_18137/g.72607 Transcript_18137/m.72607 type:complete len:522 (-) Transcript_18137:1806-3371(-)